MAPQANTALFQKDEKALCFHHELLYEAKVLDVKHSDPNDKKSPFLYKVHYKGWKNTWDDWVPQDRLRKNTDENRELATNLRKEMETLRTRERTVKPAQPAGKKRGADASARGSEERHSSVATGSRGQKRARDYEIEREEVFQTRPAVRFPMPDRLKSLLVDDWENITKNLQITVIPAKYPCAVILDEYAAQARRKRVKGSAEMELLDEVMHGMKLYCNKGIGRLMLYRHERPQYLDIYKMVTNPTHDLAGKDNCDIYGGAHMLRLLVSLPELIAQTNMDQQSINRLRAEVGLFTQWLAVESNAIKYATSEYENTTEEYRNRLSYQ